MTKLKVIWVVMIFLWVASPQWLTAQTSNIEALKERLQRTSIPFDKMDIYFQLAELNLARNSKTIATYQANQALSLAKNLRNKRYIRKSNILLGKTFIKQGDYSSAIKFLTTGQNLSKKDGDLNSYLDAATILSGIEIQNNNYKRAYEINLEAINFIKRKKGNFGQSSNTRNSGSATEIAALKNNLKTVQTKNIDLKEEVVILNDELERMIGDIAESELGTQRASIGKEIDTVFIYSDTSAVDVSKRIPIYSPLESPRTSLFRYLTIGLGILSLGFFIGLLWLWKKYQKSQNNFEDNLTKKDRLLRNYKEELEEQESLKNLSILGGGTALKSTHVDQLSILVLDLDDSVKGLLKLEPSEFAKGYESLMRDIRLICSQHSNIFYIKKMGSKLFFGSGISKFRHDPDQLLALAKQFAEYFKDNKALGNKAKIAVHSGPVVLSASDVNMEQLDILGATFDQCEWLVNHTQGGQILVSNETRILASDTKDLAFFKSQTDTTGQTIELYELN